VALQLSSIIEYPLSRVNTIVRNVIITGMEEKLLKIADLELDSRSFMVKRDKREILLTPQEFSLLEYLMINKGRIVSRTMILSQIWKYSSDLKTRVVDVYIGYLRKKIDKDANKKLIHSVRGFGYVIKE